MSTTTNPTTTTTSTDKDAYAKLALRTLACVFASTYKTPYSATAHLAAYNARLTALGIPPATYFSLWDFNNILSRLVQSGTTSLSAILSSWEQGAMMSGISMGSWVTDAMLAAVPMQKLQAASTTACSGAMLDKAYTVQDFGAVPLSTLTTDQQTTYATYGVRLMCAMFGSTLQTVLASASGYTQKAHIAAFGSRLDTVIAVGTGDFVGFYQFPDMYTALFGSSNGTSLNDIIASRKNAVWMMTDLMLVVMPLTQLQAAATAESAGVDFARKYTSSDILPKTTATVTVMTEAPRTLTVTSETPRAATVVTAEALHVVAAESLTQTQTYTLPPPPPIRKMPPLPAQPQPQPQPRLALPSWQKMAMVCTMLVLGGVLVWLAVKALRPAPLPPPQQSWFGFGGGGSCKKGKATRCARARACT